MVIWDEKKRSVKMTKKVAIEREKKIKFATTTSAYIFMVNVSEDLQLHPHKSSFTIKILFFFLII